MVTVTYVIFAFKLTLEARNMKPILLASKDLVNTKGQGALFLSRK